MAITWGAEQLKHHDVQNRVTEWYHLGQLRNEHPEKYKHHPKFVAVHYCEAWSSITMYFSGIGVPIIELLVTGNKALRIRGDCVIQSFIWYLHRLAQEGAYPMRYSLRYMWTNPDYDNKTERVQFSWLPDGLNAGATVDEVVGKANRYWMNIGYPAQAFDLKEWTPERLLQAVYSVLVAEYYNLLFQRQFQNNDWQSAWIIQHHMDENPMVVVADNSGTCNWEQA